MEVRKMRNRLCIVLLLGVISLSVGAEWRTASSEGNSNESRAAENSGSKKKGNSFVRAVSSPFKAFARLFGEGKKSKPEQSAETASANKESNKADKDLKRFETVGVVRIRDANSPAATPSDGREPASELVARGREMLAGKHLSESIEVLSRAISLDPSSREAYSLLGVALDRKGLPQAARDAYERALKINPTDADTLNNLGYSLYRRGEYSDAVSYLKRAVKAAPGEQRFWNNLALAQCRVGKYDDAYKSFAQAGGEFKARMNVAKMLESAGKDKDALKHYEAARRLDPNAKSLLQHLAEVYQRLGRGDQAETARQQLLAPSKSNAKGEVSGGGE
jgi:Flp pilus assembly protein TadD